MRADVLVYTTPPLTRAVETAGPIRATLFISSDRKDTDLTIRLLDVNESGHAWTPDTRVGARIGRRRVGRFRDHPP